MVLEDLFMRQSLPAIAAWEDIIAAWEAEDAEPPRFPVPSDGAPAAWPNPVPRPFIPSWAPAPAVVFTREGEEISVGRTPGDAARVASGAEVACWRHPGGGDRNRWGYRFTRRFDRLLCARPSIAPFAITAPALCDLVRGPNVLPLALRNAAETPLVLDIQLRHHATGARRTLHQERIELAPHATRELRLPVVLDGEGGGILAVTAACGDTVYRLHVFTHVEEVHAVLEGTRRILKDTPDPAAAARLESVHRRAAAWTAGAGAAWRELFLEASALRDELLLARITFDRLLFITRAPFDSEQPFMDAHHLRNRPGGAIHMLAPARPGGAVSPIVDSLGEGIYRDLCLHWEADRFVFAFGNGSDTWDGSQSYDIWEARLDGTPPRRLTEGPRNDAEPFYLPGGRIGFTSDRSSHYVMCGDDRHAPNLYAMDADGSRITQLSHNVFNDFNPSVLPDGRILYSRWEYNERSVTSLHNPFTVHADGRMMAPYYGNATIRPNVVMFPRPVPDALEVMALFTAHHGQTHGAIGLIDVALGVDGDRPLTVLTPGVPVTGEKIEDSRVGWYSDPRPLSLHTYLCAYTPTVVPWLARSWGLYVGDRHGNLALVHRDPALSCAEPLPVERSTPPHPLPRALPGSDRTDAAASLLVLDVYEGLGDVPRGTARYVRILEDIPRTIKTRSSVVITAGTSIYTIKRVLGFVPIADDGSAYFTVPSNTNVYFQLLDAQHREIQRMRSVVCLKPGEVRTCTGCHEPRTTAPPNHRQPRALLAPPATPAPPPWGDAPLSFLRDVQPVLNEACAGCHTHDRRTARVILTDDLTERFTIAYEELLPYLSVANAMRWDHPDDVLPQPPYTYGSAASRLTRILESGHHDVQLSEDAWQRLLLWIDSNAVYYDRYETPHYDNRQIFTGRIRSELAGVYARRCAECHGGGDGRFDTWWMTLNRRVPALSRMLMAPLAADAGGWERCAPAVFESRDDPDHARAGRLLAELARMLEERPREDLVSIRGTPAMTQAVAMPAPPPPRPPSPPAPAPEEGAVYLSDLRWTYGRSGWSTSGDGLPRRDRGIDGGRIMLDGRVYDKGIGTHAPSEIRYALEKRRWSRLRAVAGGGEAGGTVVFRVRVDGADVYDSGLLRGLRDVAVIDIDISSAEELSLIVGDAGDGHINDVAHWAAARLVP